MTGSSLAPPPARPGTLETALVADRERLAGLSLIGGIQISDYPFMGPVRDGNWCYDTWQVARPIRDDVATGGVGFHPCRGALVPSLIRALKPDVFLTVVSPPDELGNVSFGASVSYALTMAREVGRVVAEINPAMPRTHGHPRVPLDSFDAIVESQAPLPTYRGPAPEPITQKIAENVRGAPR